MMFWFFLFIILCAVAAAKVVKTHTYNKRYQNSPNWHAKRKTFQHYWKRNLKILKWKAAWEYLKAPSPKWPDSIPLTQKPDTQTTNQITNIGHATFLVQLGGVNILTDPVFSNRAGPFGIFGPKRIIPPGISLEDLPTIHIVFISHNHYDHLDATSVKAIAKRHNATFFVPLGLKYKLQKWCPKHTIIELDWWEKHSVQNITVSATPAQHWSRRGLLDMNKTLWMGGIFASEKHSVFFAGDTGWGPHFGEIADKYPNIDAALLPIGAYRPKIVMQVQHMGPEDALNAHLALKTKCMIPVHYDVFKLGKEEYQEAEQELIATAKQLSIPKKSLGILHVGRQLSLPKT